MRTERAVKADAIPAAEKVSATNAASAVSKFLDKRPSYCNGSETCSWTISHLPS